MRNGKSAMGQADSSAPTPATPPSPNPHPLAPNLVDLLDRVLDRGLVINADIIICLAGVPLIGINLRAALAGMETMTKYGLMTEWDESIRGRELGRRRIAQESVKAADEPPVATA